MNANETDPHPAGSSRFVGRSCSFDYTAPGAPARRLVGLVERAVYVGRTARGALPDYTLTLRGSSGRLIEVSLVESYAVFQE